MSRIERRERAVHCKDYAKTFVEIKCDKCGQIKKMGDIGWYNCWTDDYCPACQTEGEKRFVASRVASEAMSDIREIEHSWKIISAKMNSVFKKLKFVADFEMSGPIREKSRGVTGCLDYSLGGEDE